MWPYVQLEPSETPSPMSLCFHRPLAIICSFARCLTMVLCGRKIDQSSIVSRKSSINADIHTTSAFPWSEVRALGQMHSHSQAIAFKFRGCQHELVTSPCATSMRTLSGSINKWRHMFPTPSTLPHAITFNHVEFCGW